MAGGFAGPSTLCGNDTNTGPQYDDYEDYRGDNVRGDYEFQDKKVSLNPVGKKPSFCDDPDVAPDAYTGGLVLNKAYLYNGLAWVEMSPMSVRRDNLMCSLIQKDDQVKLTYLVIFGGICVKLKD